MPSPCRHLGLLLVMLVIWTTAFQDSSSSSPYHPIMVVVHAFTPSRTDRGRLRLIGDTSGHTGGSLPVRVTFMERTVLRAGASSDNDQEKFGWTQRLDSGKSLVVGAIVGSLAGTFPELLHQLVLAPLWNMPGGTLAQFEFDNDAAGLLTGLFAVVYRYGLRQDTDNPQLPQGLIGAFVLTRTLGRIVLPSYCTAIVLNCGPPLGYLDWNVLGQLLVNGAESAAMYGATAYAMDRCMEKGWISRFPG